MKISVVVATRNRDPYVSRLLQCLSRQTRLPDEVILVDSSDLKTTVQELARHFPNLRIRIIESEPSVCLQRNRGVKEAASEWIFICDDDIELPDDHLMILENFIQEYPDTGALAGRLLQKENGRWQDQYPVKNYKDLLFRFTFQLAIWGAVSSVTFPRFLKPLEYLIKRFYARRGNTLSLAGWPLITDWSPVFKTTVYSLGANLIRRDWLLRSPYDAVLDPHGIGDNYGVALGFPHKQSIIVIDRTSAFHHRAQESRLVFTGVYYRRLLALHYFLKKKKPMPVRMVFIWSLIGKWLLHAVKGKRELRYVCEQVLRHVLLNKNPYWYGYTKNASGVRPYLNELPHHPERRFHDPKFRK